MLQQNPLCFPCVEKNKSQIPCFSCAMATLLIHDGFQLKCRKTYSTTRFHSHDFQSCRNDHPLVFVVWCRHALKTFHSIQSCLSSVLLVGQHTFKLQLHTVKTIENILFLIPYNMNWKLHTSDCSPKDFAGGSDMVWSTAGVGVHTFSEEFQVFHCNKNITVHCMQKTTIKVST